MLSFAESSMVLSGAQPLRHVSCQVVHSDLVCAEDNIFCAEDSVCMVAQMAQHQSYPSKVTWQVYMKFSSAGATVDLKPFVLPAHTGRNAAVSVVLL